MSAKILRCLVTIKRADVVHSCHVKCIVYGANYLVIPVEDYELPQAEGRRELILHAPENWFVHIENGEHDLHCQRLIDLDRFEELPWVDLMPTAGTERASAGGAR